MVPLWDETIVPFLPGWDWVLLPGAYDEYEGDGLGVLYLDERVMPEGGVADYDFEESYLEEDALAADPALGHQFLFTVVDRGTGQFHLGGLPLQLCVP